VFLTDLGLAIAGSFTLTERERAFAGANRDHDLAHALTRLADWVITVVGGIGDWQEPACPASTSTTPTGAPTATGSCSRPRTRAGSGTR
jgi:hypothetical protein